jgi:hypothetical protein
MKQTYNAIWFPFSSIIIVFVDLVEILEGCEIQGGGRLSLHQDIFHTTALRTHRCLPPSCISPVPSSLADQTWSNKIKRCLFLAGLPKIHIVLFICAPDMRPEMTLMEFTLCRGRSPDMLRTTHSEQLIIQEIRASLEILPIQFPAEFIMHHDRRTFG